jgi:hypothetical protein
MAWLATPRWSIVVRLTAGERLDILLSEFMRFFNLKDCFFLGHITAGEKMSRQLLNARAG